MVSIKCLWYKKLLQKEKFANYSKVKQQKKTACKSSQMKENNFFMSCLKLLLFSMGHY